MKRWLRETLRLDEVSATTSAERIWHSRDFIEKQGKQTPMEPVPIRQERYPKAVHAGFDRREDYCMVPIHGTYKGIECRG